MNVTASSRGDSDPLEANETREDEGWIGERYDEDADLQYLNARYYDPGLGMFTSPDWFEVTQVGVGTNRFSYSGNDPINRIDPNGNCYKHVPLDGNCSDMTPERADALAKLYAELLNPIPNVDVLMDGELTVEDGLEIIGVVPVGKLVGSSGNLARGATRSATNRTATQADVAGHFQQNRQFWTQDPIQFSGNKVFQRNDFIDPNHVSEWTVRGQTVSGNNIERMATGRAPIGPDGNSVNLHHLTQQQNGAIAEVTQTLHSTNHGILHMPNTVPSGINRAQFQTWSRDYWKQRAANWGK